jgi:hypothetical protein
VLLGAGHWDGAYYLCGYAVECALKACIARRVRRYDFPDRDLATQSYSHNLAQLVRVAGLESQLQADLGGDPALAVNWAVVKDWAERSRYERRRAQEARDLYAATADRRHGVLRWIRRHW